MSLTPEELREILIEKFMGPQITSSNIQSINKDEDYDEESSEDEYTESIIEEELDGIKTSVEPSYKEESSNIKTSVEPSYEVESSNIKTSVEPSYEEEEPDKIKTSVEPSYEEDNTATYRSNFLTPQSNKSTEIDRSLPTPKSMLEPSQTTAEPEENYSGFFYLEDDPLSRVFGQSRDYKKEYNLSLVLYKINDSLETPFLEFYFEKIDGNFCFPKKPLNMNEFQSILNSVNKISPTEENNANVVDTNVVDTNVVDTNVVDTNVVDTNVVDTNKDSFFIVGDVEESNEIEDEFLNQCSQFLMEKTGIERENSYMGFLENPDNTIFVFFDFTLFDFTKGTWGIMDEIINKHRINDTLIKETDYKLFYENPTLLFIRDERREPMEIPISGFSCLLDGSNSYHTEPEGSQVSISLINDKVDDPIFKDIYLFSYEPLLYENLDLIKRYAIFIKNSVYFLNKGFELTPEMEIIVDDQISISFYRDGKLFWAIKSVERFTEL